MVKKTVSYRVRWCRVCIYTACLFSVFSFVFFVLARIAPSPVPQIRVADGAAELLALMLLPFKATCCACLLIKRTLVGG